MSAALPRDGSHRQDLSADIRAAVKDACARVAPTWPLDRFIAVNPHWENIHVPVEELSVRLSALSGARMLMPRAWYREQYRKGALRDVHLDHAAAASGGAHTRSTLLALMDAPEPHTPVRQHVTHVADARRDLARQVSTVDHVVHHVSQFCASYFDDGQAQVRPDKARGLYGAWLEHAQGDRGPELVLGLHNWSGLCARLPFHADELVEVALNTLDVPRHQWQPYLWSLLLDVQGWASWCAYRRWTARLQDARDDIMEDLLAIRLAWDLVLFQAGGPALASRWQMAMAAWPSVDRACDSARRGDWVLQHAVEIAYQEHVGRQLSAGVVVPAPATPAVQAVFCIDVRSEVFRRALEKQSAAVHTRGFAGFFGMPVEHLPLGAEDARPQLPGLLAPRLRVVDASLSHDDAEARRARLQRGAWWDRFKSGAMSGFTAVEATGLLHGAALFMDACGMSGRDTSDTAGMDRAQKERRRPHALVSVKDGQAPTVDEKADLAAGILRAMGLSRGAARVVALLGHGSSTVNNPHAAGMDCGACCGQTGEVNARAAAALLNDQDVRAALPARGVSVPADTVFVAGLHDTTTDEVSLFDLDLLPVSHAADVERFRDQLRAAGDVARAERATRLRISAGPANDDDQDLRTRARDWAQVRPEWGLANNAAFIVAPRHHVKHVDLQGRAFLHDYTWQDDADFSVLELIMTAPMVVTHWINFQYMASTVDNRRFGSGNKLLHNVVGGHLGVFEGNGGDLRTGLPLQSLHDGTRWVHEPLRLTVILEAPRHAVDGVLSRHAHVRALVENGWLHLLQLDSDDGSLHRRTGGGWQRFLPAD